MLNAELLDWLNLVVRWAHVITAIAWIGASFYFIWLDLSLEQPSDEKLQKGFAGELWSIHGGGIYEVAKYQPGAHPDPMPTTLHWFKWEAYSTWLTGSALLVLLYYLRADTYLVGVDKLISSPQLAIAASIGYLVTGLALYELIMRTTIGGTVLRQAIALVALIIVASALAFELFAPRAAMLHVGAMIATLMAANVFFGIIPSQKAMIRAIDAGQSPDPQLALFAKHRSTHNNYLTLPVLFCMLSNHSAFVFNHPYAWLLVPVISAVAAYARHYFNLKHRGQKKPQVLIVAAIAFVAIALVASQTNTRSTATNIDAQQISRADIQSILDKHCSNCHAPMPKFPGYASPPGGLVFTSPEHLLAEADRVSASIASNYMPLANMTKITQAERDLLIGWAASSITVGKPEP